MSYVGTTVKEEKIHGIPKWQAESDLRTLRDSHAIQKDAKRHKAAKHMATKEIGALAHIAGKQKKLGA